MAKEAVEHPPHYGGEDDSYETIKALANKLTPEEFSEELRPPICL